MKNTSTSKKEETKLSILKLQTELKLSKVQPETIEENLSYLNDSVKITTRKSNLYKILLSQSKVSKVSISNILNNNMIDEKNYCSRRFL